MDSKTCGVGLVGFGAIGTGVARLLIEEGEALRARTGLNITLKRICDIDTARDRGVALPAGVLTADLAAVLGDPEIRVVVELVGGTTIAKDITLRAIAAGKSIVTANKALLAHHGGELWGLARAQGVCIAFEASCAGAIPIIAALSGQLAADRVEAIYGIVNGTCNYILTRMKREGAEFDAVLKDAQR